MVFGFLFTYEIYSFFPRNIFLDILMSFVTRLGDEDALIVILVILFWFGNYRTVSSLHLAFFLSYFLNSVLKAYFSMPRPSLEFLPIAAQSIALRHIENSPGMPSGHSQTAITVYLLLAFLVKNKLTKFILCSIAFLIPISRLYLGVHFLGDVVVGLLLGLLVLVLAWFGGKYYLQKQAEHFFIFTVIWLTLVLSFAAWYGEKSIFVSGGSLVGYFVFLTLWKKQNKNQNLYPICPKLDFLSLGFFLASLFFLFLARGFLKWLLPSWPLSDMLRYFLLVGLAMYLVPLLYNYLFKKSYE